MHHHLMDWLRKWLPLLVILGILLDLGISWVLIMNSSRANCWDNVLDRAVTTHVPRHVLEAQARACAKL